MRFIRDDANINFVAMFPFTGVLSLFVPVIMVFMLLHSGLNLGIDFVGGASVHILHKEKLLDIQNALKKSGSEVTEYKSVGKSDEMLIRIKTNGAKILDIVSALKSIKKISIESSSYVGPQIGVKEIRKSFIAVICAIIGIFLYLYSRFRIEFAIGGILALLHDVAFVMLCFPVSGAEFSKSSVIAILIVLGYSINDSVVIFEKLKLNYHRIKLDGVKEVINYVINSTLPRTMITSITTIIPLGVVMCFSDGNIFKFASIMFCGIAIGTYSSIFISVYVVYLKNIWFKKPEV